MDVKVNKNGSKTIQIKATRHRQLKRVAGTRKLFECVDEALRMWIKQEALK